MAQYSRTSEIALAAFSGNRCYWPDCDVPTVVKVSGQPVVNVQRAHIKAKNPGGPRYDATMTDRERDDWPNIIWLCHPHHTYLDRLHPDKFAVEQLQQWKRDREADTAAGLIGLGRVTEERLQELIAEAVEVRNDRLDSAVQRLEELGDVELAAVVRDLRENVNRMDDVGGFPDRTTVAMLSEAASELQYLTPSLVEQLAEAAYMMRHLRSGDY